MSTVWSWILLFIVILLFANVILSGFVVFFERRNPASTWAWLLVLLFIPIFGFFAYMVFGRNSKREKMFREKEKYDQEVYYKYLFQDVHSAEEITEQKAFIENKGKLPHAEYVTDLAHLHLNSGNWITFNNKIEYFNNGKDKFEALVQDIRNAKEYIHLEYYIIEDDPLGREIADILIAKAQRVLRCGFFMTASATPVCRRISLLSFTPQGAIWRRFCPALSFA